MQSPTEPAAELDRRYVYHVAAGSQGKIHQEKGNGLIIVVIGIRNPAYTAQDAHDKGSTSHRIESELKGKLFPRLKPTKYMPGTLYAAV